LTGTDIERRWRELEEVARQRGLREAFGGWNFAASDIEKADFADLGYRNGVPMGGDLLQSDRQGAPTFLVQAARDPDAAFLDRVQVIKGWLDADGETHQRVYDIAWSGDRKPDAKGRVPAVESTLDMGGASYSNALGAPELATWWQDPNFDPGQATFYYIRVLEIPTPRWTEYDAAYFRITPPEGTSMIVQERAYSSPIWYRP